MNDELAVNDLSQAGQDAIEELTSGNRASSETGDILTDYHSHPHNPADKGKGLYDAALSDDTEFTITVKDMMGFIIKANDAVSHPVLGRNLEKQYIGMLPSIFVYSVERFFAINPVNESTKKKKPTLDKSTLVYSVDWWGAGSPTGEQGLKTPVLKIKCTTDQLLGGAFWNPYPEGKLQHKEFQIIADKGDILQSEYLDNGGTEKTLRQFMKDGNCQLAMKEDEAHDNNS